ncbi:MAG: GNAT family N-acetyltransferase [Bacillota bacterium]
MISSYSEAFIEINTPHGPVFVEGPASEDYLKTLKMNQGLANFRMPDRQHEALCIIARAPEGLVYIARNNDEIIGYVVFHYPSQFSRWSKHPRVLELGAIEVASKFKRYKLGTNLLKAAFTNPVMEEYIMITTEFFWHWDLKDSSLDVWNYQRMLTKLFGSVHFKKRRTDDPEILEHPANMLMVRVGTKVSPAYIKSFEEMLYQQSIVE